MKTAVTLLLSCFALCAPSRAITVDELQNLETLTPQTFANHFADFQFVFRAEVQSPEVFLSTRSGDCDDFSTLAARELSARGYTTRLVAVRMKKEVHVVCYVEEAKGYLDYNLRARGGFVPCGSGLDQIATAVAKSFKNAAWTSTSEFTYGQGMKRLVKTVLPQGKLTASVR